MAGSALPPERHVTQPSVPAARRQDDRLTPPRPAYMPISSPKTGAVPKDTFLQKESCPAADDCVCFHDGQMMCWTCGRCINGCIPPCKQAMNNKNIAQTLSAPESHETVTQPFTYALIFPCPGEGLAGTGEYCATRNLCNECLLC